VVPPSSLEPAVWVPGRCPWLEGRAILAAAEPLARAPGGAVPAPPAWREVRSRS